MDLQLPASGQGVQRVKGRTAELVDCQFNMWSEGSEVNSFWLWEPRRRMEALKANTVHVLPQNNAIIDRRITNYASYINSWVFPPQFKQASGREGCQASAALRCVTVTHPFNGWLSCCLIWLGVRFLLPQAADDLTLDSLNSSLL